MATKTITAQQAYDAKNGAGAAKSKTINGQAVLGTSNDGISHLANGQYVDAKGNVLSGAQSLGQARNVAAGKSPDGGKAPETPPTTTNNSDGTTTNSTPGQDTGTQIPTAVSDADKIDFTNPNSTVAGGLKINSDVTTQNTLQDNPTINSDAGTSTVVRNADGSYTRTDARTGANKALNDQQIQTGTLGSQVAGDIVGKAATFDPNAAGAANPIPKINQDYITNYQNAAYQNLTQGLQDKRTQAVNDMQQTLANRGVGQGTDEYEKEMKAVTDEYDQQDAAAKAQAYQSGLQAATTYGTLGINGFTAAVNGANSSQTTAANSAATLNGLTTSAAPTTQTFTGDDQAQVDTGTTFGQEVSKGIAAGQDATSVQTATIAANAKKSAASTAAGTTSTGPNFVG